jgi:hypothetical protein
MRREIIHGWSIKNIHTWMQNTKENQQNMIISSKDEQHGGNTNQKK